MRLCWLARRAESESRAQRFSVVHLSFAKKEAALKERLDEAELTAEHLRQARPVRADSHSPATWMCLENKVCCRVVF